MVQGFLGFTDEAKEWLIKILDPNHDQPLEKRGVPDCCNGKTLLREYRSSKQVGKPAGFPAGQWDMQVSHLPFTKGWSPFGGGGIYEPGILTDKSATAVVGNGWQLGPVVIASSTNTEPATAANLPWPPTTTEVDPSAGGTWNPLALAASKTMTAFTPEDLFLVPMENAPYRIVAQSFEVINTTEAQYLNGTATAYRVNSEFDAETVTAISLTADIVKVIPADYDAKPPRVLEWDVVSLPHNRPADVMNLPGTSQWSAAEGAYCVAAMDPEMIHQFGWPMDPKPILGVNDTDVERGVWAIGSDNYTHQLHNLDTTLRTVSNAIVPCPLSAVQTSGVMFTRLSHESTFTVNVRILYEFLPDARDPDITLASQSTAYDPEALAAYARAMRNMPVAVPLSMNPGGEYYAGMMRILAVCNRAFRKQ
jgi:hypothetical protein